MYTNPRHPIFQLTRIQTQIFKHVDSDSRCKICKVPLSESAGWFAQLARKDRSEANPHFCNSCETWVKRHPGGAEIPISVLFAVVRDSPRGAEERTANEFAALKERFYKVGSEVLHSSDAMVDHPAEDELRGFYTQVGASRRHARKAIQGGVDLLAATGHDEPGGPWIPMGVAIHTGTAHVGTVDGDGQVVNITASGDMIDSMVRLSSDVSAGELVVSSAALNAARLDPDGAIPEPRRIEVEGAEPPIDVHSIPWTELIGSASR